MSPEDVSRGFAMARLSATPCTATSPSKLPILSAALPARPSPSAANAYIRAMRPRDLLCPKPSGLYCAPGDFYIDPVRPVPRALITHGHSDHARSGHESVLATRQTLDIMALRYGEDFAGTTQEAVLGETVHINGVAVTFHPAGHVL